MKSPMISNTSYIPDKSGYGELEVLMSAAGYYVGTLWTERDPQTGEVLYREPGSRDSCYYATREEAERALHLMKTLGDETASAVLRQHP